MKKLLQVLLLGLIPVLVSADGIGGGGTGVRGASNILPNSVGVGVQPTAAIPLSASSVEVGAGGQFEYSSAGYTSVISNMYYDGANWKYKVSSFGSLIRQGPDGSIKFYTAPSGTAGNTATVALKLEVANDGTLTSSKACAVNYTRKAPNLCMLTNPFVAMNALIRDTCIGVGVPSGATAVILKSSADAISANSVALRYTYVNQWDTSSCAVNSKSLIQTYVREFSAVAAGAILNSSTNQNLVVPTSGIVYLKFEDDTGNGGFAWYLIDGYFD